jgi:YhcH/YjgK/YiaL family protein
MPAEGCNDKLFSITNMIIATIANAAKYAVLHPLFAKALQYMADTRLDAAEPGKVAVADGLTAIFSEAPGKTQEVSFAKFECYHAHIDIQYCISGKETLGWKPRETCLHSNGHYNPDKDVQFFNDTPDSIFNCSRGSLPSFFRKMYMPQ